MSPPIGPARPDETDTLAALIGHAFHPLAVSGWLVPDPAERTRILPRTFALIVEHALQYGQVQVTADRTAVAVWLDRTGPDLPTPADYPRRLAAASGRHADRFRTLDQVFDAHHPADPHHHLALLAVHPDRQNTGIGSVLLDHHHAHLDRHRLPGYLEAASERSTALYARHGYRPHRPGRILLPDGPALYPMWRTPQP